MHRSLDGCLAATADPTSKRVVDQPTIHYRFANIYKRMMHNPLLETRGRDNTFLRVSNHELMKPAKLKMTRVESMRY
jgi:hypothetical protein